ncbi:hypothetical protein P4O66_017854 [Electrophorus voltai]|uniref:AP complex mu/sigma subunit domain-containing protein n=1 Tax=Electrophorus voltai TaxID=2609070 RepID=A0AAD9DLH7_9TELE|nr:hypothetical protein P4O66_017854 [Electrophorus voltai]
MINHRGLHSPRRGLTFEVLRAVPIVYLPRLFFFCACSLALPLLQIRFLLLFSRQGRVRLQKWFTALSEHEKKKVVREMSLAVLTRPPKACNFLQWKDLKVVYRRYASLYFCCGLEQRDNELLTLEIIHRYVELLDQYFGNVCELDIIFNFEKAYFILDEFIIGGEIQETSKMCVAKSMEEADANQEVGHTHTHTQHIQGLSRGETW